MAIKALFLIQITMISVFKLAYGYKSSLSHSNYYHKKLSLLSTVKNLQRKLHIYLNILKMWGVITVTGLKWKREREKLNTPNN